MRYVTVTTEELGHLRDGLNVLESLNEYGESVVQIYLYGLTDNPNALDVVKEAISYWSSDEIPEQDAKASEAVFIIPLSRDVLYYLSGSGLKVGRETEVVYVGGNEGPRTISLPRGSHARVTEAQFKVMAISRDTFDAEDFLLKYGNPAKAEAPQEVERTAPAQAPEPEVPTGRENVAAKKSSLSFNIEDWLG